MREAHEVVVEHPRDLGRHQGGAEAQEEAPVCGVAQAPAQGRPQGGAQDEDGHQVEGHRREAGALGDGEVDVGDAQDGAQLDRLRPVPPAGAEPGVAGDDGQGVLDLPQAHGAGPVAGLQAGEEVGGEAGPGGNQEQQGAQEEAGQQEAPVAQEGHQAQGPGQAQPGPARLGQQEAGQQQGQGQQEGPPGEGGAGRQQDRARRSRRRPSAGRPACWGRPPSRWRAGSPCPGGSAARCRPWGSRGGRGPPGPGRTGCAARSRGPARAAPAGRRAAAASPSGAGRRPAGRRSRARARRAGWPGAA